MTAAPQTVDNTVTEGSQTNENFLEQEEQDSSPRSPDGQILTTVAETTEPTESAHFFVDRIGICSCDRPKSEDMDSFEGHNEVGGGGSSSSFFCNVHGEKIGRGPQDFTEMANSATLQLQVLQK